MFPIIRSLVLAVLGMFVLTGGCINLYKPAINRTLICIACKWLGGEESAQSIGAVDGFTSPNDLEDDGHWVDSLWYNLPHSWVCPSLSIGGDS